MMKRSTFIVSVVVIILILVMIVMAGCVAPEPQVVRMAPAAAPAGEEESPDLVVLDIESSQKSAADCATPAGLNVMIKNQGDVAAGAFNTVLNGPYITPSPWHLESLAAGGESTFFRPAGTPGSGVYTAMVDSDEEVAESDEDNNKRTETVDVIAITCTPTPTATLTATSTATATPTTTSTITSTPTSTSTVTLTATTTLTSTLTPTATATGTLTSTLTITPTPTATSTSTMTPTATLTGTPTSTPTITLTPTVTQTPTITPTPTVTQTPTITPTPGPTPTGFPYVVKWCDTVYSLARRFGTTVQAIVEANNLADPNYIRAGQTLIIPVEPPPPPTVHTVQPGENLFRIALRYNTTVDAIAWVNHILNPWYIQAGQKLIIPTAGVIPPRPTIYMVQPGDTLWRIGWYYGITPWAIAIANNLCNPNLIYAGQCLVIP